VIAMSAGERGYFPIYSPAMTRPLQQQRQCDAAHLCEVFGGPSAQRSACARTG
jgi:hypothetical protein